MEGNESEIHGATNEKPPPAMLLSRLDHVADLLPEGAEVSEDRGGLDAKSFFHARFDLEAPDTLHVHVLAQGALGRDPGGF